MRNLTLWIPLVAHLQRGRAVTGSRSLGKHTRATQFGQLDNSIPSSSDSLERCIDFIVRATVSAFETAGRDAALDSS